MQDFWLYFSMGLEHIADWNGYDHILFVAALCLRYLLKDWKKVLILVTAFTIGHSITLALSALNIIDLNRDWVEFLIPVTIMIAALTNVLQKDDEQKGRMTLVYAMALFVGLIHGLGFANFFKSFVSREDLIEDLLAFNIGLEAGQLLIVTVVLLLTAICVTLLKISRREYVIFMSGGIFGIALLLAIERFPI